MTYTQLRQYKHTHPESLLALQDGFKDVINAMPFPVMLIDESYTILFVNHTMTRLSGLSVESLLGKNYHWAVWGRKRPEENCPVKMCVKRGEKTQGESYHSIAKMWIRSYVERTHLLNKRGSRVYLVILEDITKNKLAQKRLEENILKQKAITESGIKAICRIVEARDPFTSSHQAKVGSIAYLISKEIGKSDRYASGVQAAGMLHDVGKITVPIEILCKPTTLTKLEFEVIKHHPAAGYEILKDIEYEIPIAEIALQHHERLDGSGYPYGLKGDKIHLSTKIVSVADVLDAMSSHRPYRPGYRIEEAVSHLRSMSGTWYDKECVEAAVSLCERGIIQPDSVEY
jgi:PAS domain S-box-containing protein